MSKEEQFPFCQMRCPYANPSTALSMCLCSRFGKIAEIGMPCLRFTTEEALAMLRQLGTDVEVK